MKKIPVILAGGTGKRFWPLSRKERPKQNLTVFFNKPMIQVTYERLKNFDHFAIVANSELCQSFKDILPEEIIYIEEPVARNTAPAIALAVSKLYHEFGDFIVFIETADHYYKNPPHYIKHIDIAMNYAEKFNKIVLIGIQPTSPNIGYGYIKQGKNLEEMVYNVDQFKEKPDLETARKYVESGTYLWNSGMFIAKASVFLNNIANYLPKLGEILETIKKDHFSSISITNNFPLSPNISIDYGVMEKSEDVVVLASNMDWDDIGDYNAFARVLTPDSNNNYTKTETISSNSKNNIVIGDKLVTLIGVDDLIIVDTEDVLLVCKRSESQKVKDIFKDIDEKYH